MTEKKQMPVSRRDSIRIGGLACLGSVLSCRNTIGGAEPAVRNAFVVNSLLKTLLVALFCSLVMEAKID
jgi:hypothetical protein